MDELVQAAADQIGTVNIHKLQGNFSDIGVHAPCGRSKSIDSGLDADMDGFQDGGSPITVVARQNGCGVDGEFSHDADAASWSHKLHLTIPPAERLNRSSDLSEGDFKKSADVYNKGSCDSSNHHITTGVPASPFLGFQDFPHTPLDTVPELSASERASDQSDEAIESQAEGDSQSDSISQSSPDALDVCSPLSSPTAMNGCKRNVEERGSPPKMTLTLSFPFKHGNKDLVSSVKHFGSNSSLSDQDSVAQKPPTGRKTRSKKRTSSSKQSWLLRLFESKLFDMSIAITYLFNSKEPGVQTYLGEF